MTNYILFLLLYKKIDKNYLYKFYKYVDISDVFL